MGDLEKAPLMIFMSLRAHKLCHQKTEITNELLMARRLLTRARSRLLGYSIVVQGYLLLQRE